MSALLKERPVGADVPRVALSVREAAHALGLSERTVWSLVKAGELPAVRVGRRLLIGIDQLRAWVAAQSAPARGGQDVAAG